MSELWVCGLDAMAELVRRVRPGRLISLLPSDEQPPTPRLIAAADHLRVLVDDIESPHEGLAPPSGTHVDALIAFLRVSPPDRPLVIHCMAGVSRSPAAALIALALESSGRERDAAQLLRRAAPFAKPNRLIVELADRALARRGALIAALDTMGYPDMTFDFEAFVLPRVV